jgi:hypothetical protein
MSSLARWRSGADTNGFGFIKWTQVKLLAMIKDLVVTVVQQMRIVHPRLMMLPPVQVQRIKHWSQSATLKNPKWIGGTRIHRVFHFRAVANGFLGLPSRQKQLVMIEDQC